MGSATDIIAVSPSNVWDTHKMKYLLSSAKEQSFDINIIGIGKPFVFFSKITLLKEFLEGLPSDENPIVCFTDAYDVFYIEGLEKVKQLFLEFDCDIVWSAEKFYSHQLKTDKSFYDSLDKDCVSPYKYINTGTFIGYKNSLLALMTDIIASTQDPTFLDELKQEGWTLTTGAVDQTIISHHLCRYWDKYSIKLDKQCRIFYLPVGDWESIDRYVTPEFNLVITGNRPCICHVPWKSRYESLMIELYHRIYARQSSDIAPRKNGRVALPFLLHRRRKF